MSEPGSTAVRDENMRRVTIRVPEGELRRWKVAAATEDKSLSEWMRDALSTLAAMTGGAQ